MFCTNCGANLNDDMVFCTNCGKQMKETDAGFVTEEQVEGTMAQVATSWEEPTVSCGGTVAMPPVEDRSDALKKKRFMIVGIVAGAIALVALIVGVVLWFMNDQADKALHQGHPVSITINAAGYSDADTMIPLQVKGTDLDGNAVDVVCFVDGGGNGLELTKGTYAITVPASPLTVDGVLYNVPSDSFSITIPDDYDSGADYDASQEITVSLTKSTALDETDAMIQSAYEYARMNEEQLDKAEKLHDVAVKAHANAVAEAEEQARIAAEKHLAMIEPKADLASYSWEELSKIAEEISYAGDSSSAMDVAKKYHLVGSDGMLNGSQAKSVSLSGGITAKAQLAGIYHDDKADGSGKAGLTFIFDQSIAERPMNTHNTPGGKGLTTNVGGWKESDLRAWLANEGMSMLPADLRNVIRAVNKKSNNDKPTDNLSAVTSTQDKLWEPSVVEVYGRIDWSFYSFKKYNNILNAEGSQYKLFKDQGITSNVDVAQKGPLVRKFNGKVIEWWTRSIAPSGGNTFFPIYPDSDNLNSSETAGCSDGVVPGFCL